MHQICIFLWWRLQRTSFSVASYKGRRASKYIYFISFSFSFQSGSRLTRFCLSWCFRFKPDVISGLVTKATIGWVLETILLKASLFTLGSANAPTLDVVAYGGYAFIGISVTVVTRFLSIYAYYFAWVYTSLCMAIFLVRTMKRLLFAETRRYDRDSTMLNYLLILMGVAQFPLFYWLAR